MFMFDGDLSTLYNPIRFGAELVRKAIVNINDKEQGVWNGIKNEVFDVNIAL